MNRYISLGLILIFYLALTGCTHERKPLVNVNLTREVWMRHIETNPAYWTRGADTWFLANNPNITEFAPTPYSSAFSTMNIQVPDFSSIKVNADFQVQIFSTYGPNTVYVYGPNAGVRETLVTVKGGTLCINQVKKAHSVRQVIVRIGVNRLHNLIQLGRGRIEGIQLHSNALMVTSMGSGNVYLSGNMNLIKLKNGGSGCVTMLGVNTPQLDILTNGSNTTNISGNVGIRSITHFGRNNINIIGANTNILKIFAKGRGKIGISGIVSLRELKASGSVRVYINRVNSSQFRAYVNDRAQIGLAGFANNVYIDACKSACVGARNLCAASAYVRAHDGAHVNIAASNKLFVAATENSSVNFFGDPGVMTQFLSGNATVFPIWSKYPSCPIVRTVYHSYKGEPTSYKGERRSGFPYVKRFKGEG